MQVTLTVDADDPLQNMEAEQTVLGSIMADAGTAIELTALLKPDHFTNDLHQRIFEEAVRISALGKHPDAILMKTALVQRYDHDGKEVAELLAEYSVSSSYPEAARGYAQHIMELAAKRELREGCRLAMAAANSGDVDFADALEKAQAAVMDSTDAADPFQSTNINDCITLSQQPVEASGGVRIYTGLNDFDGVAGALESATQIIVAARPSVGKSTIAQAIVENAAMAERQRAGGQAKAVALFSIETTREIYGRRSLASFAHRAAPDTAPTYEDLKSGDVSAAGHEACELGKDLSAGLKIEVFDMESITVAMMRAACRRLKAKHGLALIVVDYLQLIQPAFTKGFQNREREVAEISRSLKAMAKALKVPVVTLAQLNRDVDKREDKRPLLADLRESGSIEQDADLVVMLHSEAYYAKRQGKPKGADESEFAEWLRQKNSTAIEMITVKNKHGKLGTAKVDTSLGHARVFNMKATQEALV